METPDPTVLTAATPPVVTFDTPIRRGEQTIGMVELRKPQAGELRGITLAALTQLDYAAMETLIPRISSPTLTKADVATLDPVDLIQIGEVVMDFLLPKRVKPDFRAQ